MIGDNSLGGVYTSSAKCPICGGSSRASRINPVSMQEEIYCLDCGSRMNGLVYYKPPMNEGLATPDDFINIDRLLEKYITFKGRTFKIGDILDKLINILDEE